MYQRGTENKSFRKLYIMDKTLYYVLQIVASKYCIALDLSLWNVAWKQNLGPEAYNKETLSLL